MFIKPRNFAAELLFYSNDTKAMLAHIPSTIIVSFTIGRFIKSKYESTNPKIK
ncbi:MAG: hypothetical protein SPL89_09870 [Clostridia bacterium]|nr:hypothetical protein [Clostridia bacterium]